MKRWMCCVLGAFVTIFSFTPSQLPAQITAFTYQGRLDTNGQPANGLYDFQFRLYDAPTNGGQIPVIPVSPGVPVSNGLFTTGMDFGSNVFNGTVYYLEIAVQPKNGGGFVTLSPRQAILPVPGAVFATSASNLLGTLPAAQLSGTIASGTLPASPNFSGTVTAAAFSGGGSSLTSLDAGNISSGTLTDARLSGNVALRGGGNTFTGVQTFNGPINLNDTNGFGQSSVGNFFIDAPFLPGGRVAVLTNGNVGIGTPSPQYKLDVNGDIGLPLPATIYGGIDSIVRMDLNGNFFSGRFAGNLTLSGLYNVGVGYGALFQDTTGFYNTAIGAAALNSNTNGNYNTAVGVYAAVSNTSGNNNVANGYQALYSNTSGADNTAEGSQALYSNTSGSNNTAGGYQALYANTTGSSNTAYGYQALYSDLHNRGNTAFGDQALYSNVNGSENTANGYLALYSATGSQNTASGYQALYANVSGGGNTAVGSFALMDNTNGNSDTAIGLGALGSGRTASGNTAVGYNTLSGATSDNNIAIGFNAGDSIFFGGGNIDIGNSGANSDTNVIRIGSSQTATVIAGIYGITASGGTPVYINSAGQLGTLTSSRRYKQNIQNMDDTSEVLLSLQPVTFQYKAEIDPQGLAQFGLIAEQVEKVDPDLVVHDKEHGIYTVRYEAVNAMLLNEFLKQHKTVVEQNAEIHDLQESVASLKNRDAQEAELRRKNELLEQRLGALEKMLFNQKQN